MLLTQIIRSATAERTVMRMKTAQQIGRDYTLSFNGNRWSPPASREQHFEAGAEQLLQHDELRTQGFVLHTLH